MTRKARPSVPVRVQCEVYFRDQWLCYICRRPLVFPLAMKLLGEVVKADGVSPAPAYFNLQWRRDLAPLLDELACSIDHVEAYSKAGAHSKENFAAICARCNARKSAKSRAAFLKERSPWKVKSKYGEPELWDGLTSVFVALARQSERPLTSAEKAWLKVLSERTTD